MTSEMERRFLPAPMRALTGGSICEYNEDEDDALLEASSFGSAQARVTRGFTPAAAREHAYRMLGGCEVDLSACGVDADDAVGELVYGIANCLVPAHDDLEPEYLYGYEWLWLADSPPIGSFVGSCPFDSLWPDQRVLMLQALVEHNALAQLRSDVVARIAGYVRELARPPIVLVKCLDLALDGFEIEVAAFPSGCHAHSSALESSAEAAGRIRRALAGSLYVDRVPADCFAYTPRVAAEAVDGPVARPVTPGTKPGPGPDEHIILPSRGRNDPYPHCVLAVGVDAANDAHRPVRNKVLAWTGLGTVLALAPCACILSPRATLAVGAVLVAAQLVTVGVHHALRALRRARVLSAWEQWRDSVSSNAVPKAQ